MIFLQASVFCRYRARKVSVQDEQLVILKQQVPRGSLDALLSLSFKETTVRFHNTFKSHILNNA